MGHVVVIGEIPERVIAGIEARHSTVHVSREGFSAAAHAADLARAHGLLVTGQLPIDSDLLTACPQLRVVSLRAVGYDKVDLTACRDRGVAVCNTPGVLDGAVADLTVLLLLATARRFDQALAAGHGGWAETGDRPPLGHDLRGKTLGVYGLGRIGRLVAGTCATGFGMSILYHNRRPLENAPVGAQWVPKPDLFARSDFLTIHVPLTSETRCSVRRPEFDLMQRHALLVNTSRGEIVDEAALIEALTQGRIAGAGLDVTSVEPLPPEHPLCRAPNVLITPHIGSATIDTRQAMAEMAADNLLAVLDGSTPLSQVA